MSLSNNCNAFITPSANLIIHTSNSPRIDPIFTRRNIHFQSNGSSITKSALWRFILFSDGDLSHHLSVLNGQAIKARILSTHHLTNRLIERKILLQDEDGCPLVYSSSRWHKDYFMQLIQDNENQILGDMIHSNRLETNRRVNAIYYGSSEQISNTLEVSTNDMMWARDYVCNHNQVELMSAHQVFSPKLEKLVGQMDPPPIL